MAVRTAYDPTAGEVLTAANLERLPGGWIGYVEKTADQLNITTAETDLTSLSVAVTVGTSRRIRVSTQVQLSADALQTLTLRIKEGAADLQYTGETITAAGYVNTVHLAVILTPSSGAHTYKVSLQASGSTVDVFASATRPNYLLVEDIGPAS